VAEQITQEDFNNGLIYPPIKNIREVSINVAVKIAEEIFKSGLARVKKPKNFRKFIKSKMYEPIYK
jgi:malate dehydrogenase (oxaloacetate-decarboxylating)(NADP+)